MTDRGFTAALTADVRAQVEHPDPAGMTPEQRRHLGLPETRDNEPPGRAAADQESDR